MGRPAPFSFLCLRCSICLDDYRHLLLSLKLKKKSPLFISSEFSFLTHRGLPFPPQVCTCDLLGSPPDSSPEGRQHLHRFPRGEGLADQVCVTSSEMWPPPWWAPGKPSSLGKPCICFVFHDAALLGRTFRTKFLINSTFLL